MNVPICVLISKNKSDILGRWMDTTLYIPGNKYIHIISYYMTIKKGPYGQQKYVSNIMVIVIIFNYINYIHNKCWKDLKNYIYPIICSGDYVIFFSDPNINVQNWNSQVKIMSSE